MHTGTQIIIDMLCCYLPPSSFIMLRFAPLRHCRVGYSRAYDWIVCTLQIAGIGPRPLPTNVESLDDVCASSFSCLMMSIAPARRGFSSNRPQCNWCRARGYCSVTPFRCKPSQPPVETTRTRSSASAAIAQRPRNPGAHRPSRIFSSAARNIRRNRSAAPRPDSAAPSSPGVRSDTMSPAWNIIRPSSARNDPPPRSTAVGASGRRAGS